MKFLNRIKPEFWDHRIFSEGPYSSHFKFRRTWYAAVCLTSAVVLAPLIFMAVMDYRVTRHEVESEFLLRTSELVSNASRTLSYFLDERKSALDFIDLLSQLEIAGHGDAFIVNHKGVLQTPSLYLGEILESISLPIPDFAPETKVFQWTTEKGIPLVIGYRYITNTPFILMVVKHKEALLKSWKSSRRELMGFLLISVAFILFVILWGATCLVNRIFRSDQKLIVSLHQVEYANKMASIGRLAAGVAHEINNPLAIINEKAGLMKDLFLFKKEYKGDEMLMGLLDSITTSVARCGRITKRLLGFARHMDVSIQSVDLGEVVREVLGFLNKEAEYRSIAVSIEEANDIPLIATDAGKLQQIILNIINNAFAAMENNGHLQISIGMAGEDRVALTISDDGCGIPEKDLKRVFEPFFSKKKGKGGAGLGLSITYGLSEEIGGTIEVSSELNKGTTFTITLPLVAEGTDR
jgi:two-component system, NtrC family, sensor kinase